MEDQKEAQSAPKEKQFTAQFVTKLPEKYHVPEDPITLDTNMTSKDLNSVWQFFALTRYRNRC